MKRTLFSILLAATAALAQPRPFELIAPTGFFGGGFSAPINPAARHLDNGWNLSGGIGVSSNYVGIMLDAMISSFGVNNQGFGFRETNQRYWAVTLDPVFHVNRRGPVDFYVTGGGGIYSQVLNWRVPSDFGGGSFGRRGFEFSDSVYRPGVDGGAGFAFDLGYQLPVKIFAEARFHRMFVGRQGVSFVPVTVGVRF